MAKTVELIDLGFKRIEKELKNFNEASVEAGIFPGTFTKAEVKEFRVKEAGLNMAQIGWQNEFGTNRIPARPFMRTSYNENFRKMDQLVKANLNLMYQGKQTLKKGLNRIGLFLEGNIKRKIRQITFPPNAPYTILIKGSSKPLIDFGQMIQSITNRVFFK